MIREHIIYKYIIFILDYQATMECNFEDLTSPGCQLEQYSLSGAASWVIRQAMPMDTQISGPSKDSTFLTGICHFIVNNKL